MNEQQPITVTDNTIEGQVAALVRYLVAAVGGFAVAKGAMDAETLTFITGLLAVVIPAALGMYKSYTNKKRTITLAHAAPDSVAQVVSRG